MVVYYAIIFFLGREIMRKEINKRNEVLSTNKKESKDNIIIGKNKVITNYCSSFNISSEYTSSRVGGYGLNLI